MDVEKLDLMVLDRVIDCSHYDRHHPLVHVNLSVQVISVDQHGNLETVISQTNDEEVTILFRSNVRLLGPHKLLIVVFLAVHLEDNVDVLSCHKESLSVVLNNSSLNIIIDNNFLIVSLVIFSVGWGFHWECLIIEQSQVDLGGVFGKC